MMRLLGLASCWCFVCLLGSTAAFGYNTDKRRSSEMSVSQREGLRDEVLSAFRHAYGSYMANAYPADELMPLSCRGRGWERRTRGTIDDALGGYALTMIDSLDMHAVVGDGEGFREATLTLLEDFRTGVLTFDRDVVVSVFEASIRVLGGLLSAHQIATELGAGGRLGPPGWYNGELLSLAYDLGKRLLPAFDTPLGIPVHRVNLRSGVPRGETRNTCSAAAGTFLVEFGALSRLTGDPSFEEAARRAVGALWERRSPLGLVGGGVKGSTGQWESRVASIGAGTDSFYEYLDKSARLLGDEEMGEMFREAYAGIEEHLKWGRWHVEVDMWKGSGGSPSNYRVTALQAFWPAVQAGVGDVRAAERTYDSLLDLWKEHEALPDFYDVLNGRLLHYGRESPLRPEMAESTLALYRATGSAKYLRAGQALLGALQENSRVECGYASVGDVATGETEDRMDSFFIAETLKYLFLLFDGSLPPKKRKSIFCTPDEEEEVARYHAQREAAAATAAASVAAGAANGTSNAAAVNATVRRESSLSPVAAAVASVDCGSLSSVPFGDGSGGDGGDGRVNAPPRCLLWSDTVLSTEGHPFLASALATATATATAGDRARGGACLQGGGGGDVCLSSPPSSSTSRPPSPSPSASNPAALPTLERVKALIVKLERLRKRERGQGSDPESTTSSLLSSSPSSAAAAQES